MLLLGFSMGPNKQKARLTVVMCRLPLRDSSCAGEGRGALAANCAMAVTAAMGSKRREEMDVCPAVGLHVFVCVCTSGR